MWLIKVVAGAYVAKTFGLYELHDEAIVKTDQFSG